ncbi:MAG: arginine N-succinyltransferase [Planctomycetota bacterium]
MTFIRLVQPQDLDGLVALAKQAGFGLTTLSADSERLARRIEASTSGAAPLLVMIDPADGAIAGTAGLFSQVGDAERAEPFYAYRLERAVKRSEALGVRREIEALHLVRNYDGPTEIGTLFLHPAYRRGGNGRVLSLSRFLLIAREPDRFDRQVISELRGVIDEHGRSPFWEALGRHFFGVDYPVADNLSARDKRFIAELMPTHPIYLSLLPAAAREVIGKVHPNTRPARSLLEGEGFHFAGMVDIFDAGPCLRCDRTAIRTIRESQLATVTALVDPQAGNAQLNALVSPTDGPFVAAGVSAAFDSEGCALPRDTAEKLRLELGATIRIAPIRAGSLHRPNALHSTTEITP